jgi:hypothetical protein
MRKEDPLPPHACPHQRTFHIGRDARGRWVVQDTHHLCGGLFVSRAAALKFALAESGHRYDAILVAPDTIELDFDAGVLGIPHTIDRLRRAA